MATVRQLTTTNKAKYIEFFKNVDGNFDKSNNTTMGLAFHEAFLYFTGRIGFDTKGDITGSKCQNRSRHPCRV